MFRTTKPPREGSLLGVRCLRDVELKGKGDRDGVLYRMDRVYFIGPRLPESVAVSMINHDVAIAIFKTECIEDLIDQLEEIYG